MLDSKPTMMCCSGLNPEGGAGIQADFETLLSVSCHATPLTSSLALRQLEGATCNISLGKAQQSADAGADSVAFVHFFPTQTKPEPSPAQSRILSLVRAKIDIPIVAIGGINPENGAPLIAAGADMLAVINGLFGAADDSSHKDDGQDFEKQVLASAHEPSALFTDTGPDTDPESETLNLHSRAIQQANSNPRKLYETRSIPGAL